LVKERVRKTRLHYGENHTKLVVFIEYIFCIFITRQHGITYFNCVVVEALLDPELVPRRFDGDGVDLDTRVERRENDVGVVPLHAEQV
jgi:hypothetical protein